MVKVWASSQKYLKRRYMGGVYKFLPLYAFIACVCFVNVWRVGRCDGRLRLGGKDLFLEDMAIVISKIPMLSLLFYLHVSKSIRGRDVLTIHVERSSASKCVQSPEEEVRSVTADFLFLLAKQTTLLWSEDRGTMETPMIVLYETGTLSRNARTGKITHVVDHRK